MRHRKKLNHLGRKSAHRKAMLSNMACSLIEHKRIKTTLAKAKALRVYVEPLITKSKNDTTHSRRVVFSYLKNKEAVKELFLEVSPRVIDRPGGYTRILKIGNRQGDNAEMAFIELVDFNEMAPGKAASSSSTGKKTRRRRKKKKSDTPDSENIQNKEQKDTGSDEQTNRQDLTKIEGIGPKIQEILYENGIETYAILADADVDEIELVLANAGNQFKSHDPSTWPEQARLANEDDWDSLKELQDKLIGGRVADETEAENTEEEKDEDTNDEEASSASDAAATTDEESETGDDTKKQ